MTTITLKQQRHLRNLRARSQDLANGVVIHPENVKAYLAEAIELIEALIGVPTAKEWYFLRDESEGRDDETCAWWVYDNNFDRWQCFYIDGEDDAQVIQDVLDGKRGSSIFKGFDAGVELILEKWGIRSEQVKPR